MKIQINSLAALERLIGGDTELDIEVRKSIVETFTRVHLRALANEPTILKIGEAVKKDLSDIFVTELRDQSTRYNTVYKLTEKAKELILANFEKHYIDILNSIISDKFSSMECIKLIENRISIAATYIADNLTDAMLNRRIDALVDKRIKDKLGL